MNLIIDIGNTRVKLAVFEFHKVVLLRKCNKEFFLEEIAEISKTHKISNVIISSVAAVSEKDILKLEDSYKLIVLNHTTKIPFFNNYATPKTLGVDRIALASRAVSKYPEENVLVIDAGTCITYDFINDRKEYLGGAISPGIRLRYKALNSYTSKLPLLETKEPTSFIGVNTETSIHSGIINGICNEIDGVINQYKAKFLNLTVVLTGGDTNFLSKQLKSSIFADNNFLLEGLETILTHNID